ncbi:amino acid ABC transporter substrate-binding protein [Paraneptunicella aestuarii]|uniref:amino acid ABC transporter substrate-binding protein n=1 Tax=Paraneptunicella aestuarii TaxID=2831148 RepID=UPI001E5B12FC|nr:amino acid ABC transporter substrate-binding protein [Paraneptunicella aestuarii]UAA37861.1 amino acid ABC transporter substrate-binding protein [Paraneptunicella aestuarii]
MRLFLNLFIVLIGLSATAAHAATWNIRYARTSEIVDMSNSYPLQVLGLALGQTNVKYRLIQSNKMVLQGRAIEQLKANREINVIWSMTDTVREEELLPVRIPIYKGLIGLRLFLVTDDYADLLAPVKELQELRRFTPIQGSDWPDVKILQANGFEVATASDHPRIYTMLKSDAASFFPRSIVEVWRELEHEAFPNYLHLEPRLAVHYPTATYFFFNKKNVVLANLVKTGFERAIANGKFDKLFMQFHRKYLEKANLDKRIVFELENPILPENTPLDRKELWFKADKSVKKQEKVKENSE